MKKLIALALVLVMVLGMVACGAKDPADGTKPAGNDKTEKTTPQACGRSNYGNGRNRNGNRFFARRND